ncbi:diguanylate cyclase [Rhodobacterales bacterium 52_120_T64]|nr:diguanylate cyclase [Rhodobacterales bacterium 52_120_T64]
MTVNYQDLSARITSLCDGETDEIALMATIAGELFHSDTRFDWVGFYRVTAPELLKIGPYQGGHGCLTIPFSRGVCGAAARLRKTQRVADVNAFDGHIACASSTQSEIVLPVFNPTGDLIAVLDIDSNQPDAFTDEDASELGSVLSKAFS